MKKTHILCSVSLVGIAGVSCVEQQKSPQQPNIVLILADKTLNDQFLKDAGEK